MLQTGTTLLLFLAAAALSAQSPFTSLTNGRDLSNWESYGGQAPYSLSGDTITGTAVVNTPNTFLCTERPYSNFILTLEFNDDAPLNSGVMARGQWRQDGDIRRIYGYQVEIDPSARGYTGGIYDEARRGWIYPLHYNDEARQLYRQGEWNELRVEAIGDNLRTYINGKAAANLVDSVDASGLICLQVHAIKEDLAGKQVRWRNIQVLDNATEADRMPAVQAPVENMMVNTLTEAEQRQGWRLLFDGSSTEGWRGAKLDEFPASGWEVADGQLRVLPGNGGESANGGDIVTKDNFSNFELVFEFKPAEGANSGVKYFVDPDLNKGQGSAIGLEYQILDDERHPDAKLGVMGNRTMASLYDLIPAAVLDVPGRGKEYKIGQWNRGRIVSKDGHVEHWLNGYKVVEYDRFSPMFQALVNYSKYRDWENFGRFPQGPILLQDHGDAVAFRTIKIREL
ncbi:3-keto-disaccharide hydrolase [Neolewinella sp.]|uniref:3-keto-disaccharide hydrolase n=1 Tax=Neolewinella sp. TaxID=2993543 RepID=UPI003B52DC25